MQRWINIYKLINMIHHVNKMKHKNHDYLNGCRAFDKKKKIYDKNISTK